MRTDPAYDRQKQEEWAARVVHRAEFLKHHPEYLRPAQPPAPAPQKPESDTE